MEMPLGQRIGALTLTGAAAWRADRPDFGGFSGLEIEPDGTLIALTDKAHWAKARLALAPDGSLAGIEGLEMGRLDGPDGGDLAMPFADSEALTREADGSFLIGFEMEHRIGRFRTLRAPEERLPALPGLDAQPLNGGLESVLALPDGRILAVAEASNAWETGFPAWLIDGQKVARLAFARRDWYAPTDLALGPEERWIYVLERRFTLIGGFGMRISRFPLDALREGTRIEPEPLAEATGAPLAENYEGLATVRDERGRTVLYAISDDNFLSLQRTLVLQFVLE